ncbi:MAG: UDP-N-acetylglucosamine 1-carboxyvinyltransferase [Firmicutes bacterium]|nr:UDP-N-acetylglucosamine 1-carboxyvinyltransferase [Bacillota bacterium]
MESLVIRGGQPLHGRVRVGGAKNASLPVIAASLLAPGLSRIEDVPDLRDVDTMCGVLSALGARTSRTGNTVAVDASDVSSAESPYDLVRAMRASFLVMGPLLARTGRVKISLPGGCAIGSRPIDLHLKGFAALGAQIDMSFGQIEAHARSLSGARVYLDFPSVGATENIMMAAVLASGVTTIENAAQEPEVVDLANFLNSMGAKVRGAGTTVLKIEGVEGLSPTNHMVIPDRIEAATFMVAAAITRGSLAVDNVVIEHLKPIAAKLREAGAEVLEDPEGTVQVTADRRLTGVDVKTMPYPGFPTDAQAQFMSLMSLCEGSSVITETVFENRFMHVPELVRMGAKIKIDGRSALIDGQTSLSGAQVRCTDLRAGAALVLAGLAADGETEISDVFHLDRGYERIEVRLAAAGADVRRVSAGDVARAV